MGKLIQAGCECGFQSEEIYFGNSLKEHQNVLLYAPSICPNCKEMLIKNYYFKNASNHKFNSSLFDYHGLFEILLRYLIPGLVQYDKSENLIKFIFFVSLACLGWIWIFMLGFSDSYYIGLFILLSVYVPSIIKTTRHYFTSQEAKRLRAEQKEADKIAEERNNNKCPNCETLVVFYNNPSLQKECKNTRKTKEEWRWSSEELYWEDFWLPKTRYYCPECKKLDMEFEMVGFWD